MCRDANWTDILKFLLLNYIAHIFTATSDPGDGFIVKMSFAFLIALSPIYGLRASLIQIRLWPYFRRWEKGCTAENRDLRIATR